ncbi:hypothetical protein NQ176_g255 [Zarea fungicola]|uniref:Uncharacterized protein n=1 Tax=Zarea fungicola TaxID=93591 RepID=A0ACC1NZQ1_9HYPO|nr:hypothetical protein NQ176_g255 [Lecanicillium fungicola]
MDVLPESVWKPDAFKDFTVQWKRNDNGSILMTVDRHHEQHTVQDKIQIVLKKESDDCLFIICSVEATQCCAQAPQGDLRDVTFTSGSYVNKGQRLLSTDLRCNERGSEVSVANFSQPRPVYVQTSVEVEKCYRSITVKFVRGLAKLVVGEGSILSAMATRTVGEAPTTTVMSLWEKCQEERCTAADVVSRTRKMAYHQLNEVLYAKWLALFMSDSLLYFEADGSLPIRTGDLKGERRRAIARFFQLLSLFEDDGLLIVSAMAYQRYKFTPLARVQEPLWPSLLKRLEIGLRQRISYFHNLIKDCNTKGKLRSFSSPVAFCRWFKDHAQHQTCACMRFNARTWRVGESPGFWGGISMQDLLRHLPKIPPENPERDSIASAIESAEALKTLDRAVKNFSGNPSGNPSKKRKKQYDPIREAAGTQIQDSDDDSQTTAFSPYNANDHQSEDEVQSSNSASERQTPMSSLNTRALPPASIQYEQFLADQDTPSTTYQETFLASLDMDSVSNWGEVGHQTEQHSLGYHEWWNCPIDEMTDEQFAELLRTPVREEIFI